MAWALQFDGVDDLLTVSNLLSDVLLQPDVPSQVAASYTFEMEFIWENSSTAWQALFTSGTVGFFIFNNRLARKGSFLGSGTTLVNGNTYKIKYVFTAGLNGVSHGIFSFFFDYGSGYVEEVTSSTLANTAGISQIMGNLDSECSLAKLLNIDVFDSTGAILLHNYSPTASNHGSGTPILTDTIGGNNATGVNMPTDGSVWIDLGGSGITVTGTAVPTQTESDIVTGGKTIILTLAGDTFVTGTSSEDGIAGGSDSDIAASGTNWDSLIKTALDNTDVVLSVGDTVATITLPAFGTYDIPSTETITWTIPAASLTTGTSDIIATPTHTVTATPTGGILSPYYFTNLLAS